MTTIQCHSFHQKVTCGLFICTVTASILRFHEQFILNYGAEHLLITKIVHTARKANIAATEKEY
jgi:hypothetical protein